MSTPGRALGLALASLAAASALAVLRTRPPAPRPASAPADTFSAARATDVLHRLLAGAGPHPVGTPENARVRDRLVGELRALGLAPALQRGFACSSWGSCAPVVNVLAEVPGAGAAKAVLLTAHHDSVGAGPGASDDGAGVAALVEVARALRAGPPLPRPVLVLFTDGEEAGLLGAEAFLGHPRAREVGAVVNLESRGTSGPSLLFEVVGAPALAARAARELPHPATSSLFAAVYERLPNDTDLTVFRRLGVPGLNLAFIGDVGRYHTPLDDLAHLDAGSIQHHGDSALALARALASSPDLEVPPRHRAVWFDVLGVAVVSWAERASLPLALAVLLVAAAGAALERRLRGVGPRAFALGALGTLLAAVAAFGAAALLERTLAALGAIPRPFVAHPGPLLAAAALLGIAAALFAGAVLARGAGAGGLRAGHGLALAALAFALALGFPGGSHLAIVPAAAAGVAAVAAALGGGARRAGVAAAGAAAVAAVLLVPLAVQLPTTMGAPATAASAALFALGALPLAPLASLLSPRARLAAAAVPVALAMAVAGVQLALPPATPEHPVLAPLLFLEDAETGAARIVAASQDGRLPPELAAAGGFRAGAELPYPWLPFPAFEAAAEPLGAQPPELQIIAVKRTGARREVRARLRSPRRAPDLVLAFPPGAPLVEVTVEGREVTWGDKVARRQGAARVLDIHAVPDEGVEVRIVLGGPAAAVLADRSPGLPAAARPVQAARDRVAVTAQDGDATVVSRRVTLGSR